MAQAKIDARIVGIARASATQLKRQYANDFSRSEINDDFVIVIPI
jgi:hypothetical protein